MNYEHSNFSISQCTFDDVQVNTVSAPPISKQNSTIIDHSAIIGATLGAAVLFLLVLSTLLFSRRKTNHQPKTSKLPILSHPPSPTEINTNSIAEIRSLSPEIDGTPLAELASKSGSSHSSRSRHRNTEPSRRQGTEVQSRSDRAPPASNRNEERTTFKLRQNRHGRIYGSNLPPITALYQPRDLFRNRSLSPRPRDSTSSIVEVRSTENEQLQSAGGRRICELVGDRQRNRYTFLSNSTQISTRVAASLGGGE